MELPRQAEGLFLGPPSLAARNLRCTLGDPGTRLSNRQLMVSVLGVGAGAGGEKGSTLSPHWCDCALFCLQQCSLNALEVSRAMRLCARGERERGGASWCSAREVRMLSRFCSLQSMGTPFPIQMKETMQCHNTNLHQAIGSPQLCALLCYGLPWLNTSFTYSHKSEWLFSCWWSHSPLQQSQETIRATVWLQVSSLAVLVTGIKTTMLVHFRLKVHFWHSLRLVVTLRRCWGN